MREAPDADVDQQEVTVVDLPRIGTPMYVVHSEGVNYRSRLEAADGDTLTLTAPLETTGPTAPLPGRRLEVFWAQTRSRVVLPCRLVEVADTAPYRWILVADGVPRHSNRREYVRGGGGGAVRLTVEAEVGAEGDAGEAVTGRLLDISEGGLRCWVARAPQVGAGDRLSAAFLLDGDEVELSATVLDVRDAWDEPGQHIICTFRTGEGTARLIRRHVFAWEIAERREFERI